MYSSSKMCLRLFFFGLTVVAAGGCAGEHPLLSLQRRQLDEVKKLTAAYDLATDADSAETQLPAIRDALQALSKIKDEFPALIRKLGQETLKVTAAKKMEKVAKELQQAEAALEIASERLLSRSDLPESFFGEIRLEATRFLLTACEALDEIRDIPDAPPMPDIGNSSDLRWLVETYEKYGSSKVVEIGLIDMDGDMQGKLIEAAGENAICLIVQGDETVAVVAPIKDFDAFCLRLEKLGEVSGRIDNRRQLDLTLGRVASQPVVHKTPSNIRTRSEQALETARMRQEAKQRQQNPTVNRAANRAKQWQKDDDILSSIGPVDPSDHARLAELLTSSHSLFDRKKAAKRLMTVNPKDVTDAALRKQIARAFRTSALEERHSNEVAVQGLVHWVGKHSVPVLIQLMDRETMSIDDHIFEALAECRDPAGAEAVARQLGNFFNHNQAVASLRRMGPVAEEALIEVAPSDDAKVSLAAIQLLGGLGTSESYDLLQQAMKSSNRDIRKAAQQSLKKIRKRVEKKQGKNA